MEAGFRHDSVLKVIFLALFTIHNLINSEVIEIFSFMLWWFLDGARFDETRIDLVADCRGNIGADGLSAPRAPNGALSTDRRLRIS